MYTVKQLSDLAGVSIRTLHYYDEIGLLKPTSVGGNGYRYYGDEALLRLQQILFYREMDMGLGQIKDILDSPTFDLVSALEMHRAALQAKIKRLQHLTTTIDRTISHLAGERTMDGEQLFAGFNEEKQKEYEKQAAELYGEESVKATVQRWNSYSAQEKERIMAEGGAVYSDLVAAMDKGPESPEVQAILRRWHQHLRYFYEPTPEVLRGLGQLYHDDPEFNANFQKLHPELPAFLAKAIAHYCDTLA